MKRELKEDDERRKAAARLIARLIPMKRELKAVYILYS